MSDLTTILRREQRRHLAMSFGLIAAAAFAGTMVTNERGVFTNIGGSPLSALARAFVASVNDAQRMPILFRHSASSGPAGENGTFGDAPFDVLGAPADLRRRLMDALGGDADGAQVAANQLPQILSQSITPGELAASQVPNAIGDGTDGGAGLGNGFAGGGSGATSTPGPAFIGDDTSSTDPTNPTDPIGGDTPPVAPVPEPAVWALLIGGFGAIGALQRRAGRIRRLAPDGQ